MSRSSPGTGLGRCSAVLARRAGEEKRTIPLLRIISLILRLGLLMHGVGARAPATLLLRRLHWRLVSHLGEQPMVMQ